MKHQLRCIQNLDWAKHYFKHKLFINPFNCFNAPFYRWKCGVREGRRCSPGYPGNQGALTVELTSLPTPLIWHT